jgi:hypothetical protein
MDKVGRTTGDLFDAPEASLSEHGKNARIRRRRQPGADQISEHLFMGLISAPLCRDRTPVDEPGLEVGERQDRVHAVPISVHHHER